MYYQNDTTLEIILLCGKCNAGQENAYTIVMEVMKEDCYISVYYLSPWSLSILSTITPIMVG